MATKRRTTSARKPSSATKAKTAATSARAKKTSASSKPKKASASTKLKKAPATKPTRTTTAKKVSPKKPAPSKGGAGSTKSAAARRHPTKIIPLPSALTRLREICLSLPETAEVEAWGEPTFRVKGKIFAMHASSGNHHGAGRPAVWILSVSMEQDLVIRARPDRYFKPPYVGPSGWIGAWLDDSPPWAEIEELLRDGWRRRAPKKLAALLAD